MIAAKKKEVLISLSDVLNTIKKLRLLFYFTGYIAITFSLFYFTIRPIKFSVEGILKAQSNHKSAPLYKALEFLGGEESDFPNDDSQIFLHSPPVLEEVIQSLNLQACLTDKDAGGRFREIWLTYKTALAYLTLKKRQPPSPILTPENYVADRLIVPDYKPPLRCAALCYLSETATSFKIDFVNESDFRVLLGKLEKGRGSLGAPFIWEGGSFTLAGVGKKGKTYGLHLIPMQQAVKSLRDSLIVQRSEESSALVHIKYTHRDRHLAAQIVNETMEQYQNYLKSECKKKITKQLTYLQQRQEETMGMLEAVLQKHKQFLEANLDKHSMVALTTELEFMAQKQGELKEALLETGSEMEHLAQTVWKESPLAISDLIARLKAKKQHENLQALSLEAARSLLRQREVELDLCCLENEQCDLWLNRLALPDFDPSSLSKTLGDANLVPRFTKINEIHRQLIDEEHWSEREREQLYGELEKEKAFLSQHIAHLKEGNALLKSSLKERIDTLQRNLLFLLCERYEQCQNGLLKLNQRAAHFPEKWLSEQKITLNTKLSIELMESITKMIEVKNIGYNLEYLMTSPLSYASPPILPDNPHLILGTLLGGVAGIVVLVLGICLYHLWKGPTASFTNLSQLKCHTLIPNHETLSHLALALLKKGKVILIGSKRPSPLFKPLFDWLAMRGEDVFILDLERDCTSFFSTQSEKDAFLTSDTFQKHLHALLNKHDRILIAYAGEPGSFELQALNAIADGFAWGITNELIEEIDGLPPGTLFFLENEPIKKLTLQAMQPMLERFLENKLFKDSKQQGSFYLSSAGNVLKRFLAKRS